MINRSHECESRMLTQSVKSHMYSESWCYNRANSGIWYRGD